MEGLEVGVGGDGNRNGDYPLVDVIGSGRGGGDDEDSNESATYNNKTDIESRPTK